MTKGKLRIVGIALLAVFIIFMVGTSYAARKNVHISEQNWTGSVVICQVMKQVLENELDIPVKITQLTGAITWQGMDKGNVDVFSDVWSMAEEAGVKKYVEEKKSVELTVSYSEAPLGWFIPAYVQKEYGINTVEDLKGQENIFNVIGDKKGDLWVGGSGWKAVDINTVRIRDYGLDFDPYVVEQWVFLTKLKESIRKKEPVIFFYWKPEWIFAQYDLVQIEEPAYDPAKWVFDEKDMEKSKITCAYELADVYVAYSMKLKERLPKAYQFFKNWYIPIDEVSFLIAEAEDIPDNPKKEPAEVAKKWIADHPEIVNDWLKGLK